MWLSRKIRRRDQVENQPLYAGTSESSSESPAATPFSTARRPEAPPVRSDGKMDISELASQNAGSPSPFGDEHSFPLPNDQITYNHPAIGFDPDVKH